MASENLYMPLRRSVDQDGGADLLFSPADHLLPLFPPIVAFFLLTDQI
jgi:hypothetical protein